MKRPNSSTRTDIEHQEASDLREAQELQAALQDIAQREAFAQTARADLNQQKAGKKATAFSMYCKTYISNNGCFPPKGVWGSLSAAEKARYKAMADAVNSN